jgi:hypothetical protein
MIQDNYHGGGSWQTDMRTYVASKIIWNPDQKLEPLVREFLYYYFGPSCAPAVAEAMGLLDEHYAVMDVEDPTFELLCNSSNNDFKDASRYPIGLLERIQSLLNNAVALNAADSSATAAERALREKRLASALCSVQDLILRNYGSYYKSGRSVFAIEFYRNATLAGITDVSETQKLADFMKQYGL